MLPFEILKMIFNYLNVAEIFIISRVCPMWKKIIDFEDDIFSILDLVPIAKTMKNVNYMKIIEKVGKV